MKSVVLFAAALHCIYTGVTAQDVTSQKLAQLQAAQFSTNGQVDTTDNGVQANTSKSLRSGPRGFNLLEDTSVRKKLIHFDRERTPERVVHALGSGAYGTFESYGDWSNITQACWLQSGAVSETFTRFSVVVASKGGSENARDTHGFATKIYSACGNQDLVGNHLSSFFINDGAEFPDLIHAVKYEANLGFPTDGTAHTTAYDFFNQHPESAFQLMNVLSDLGIPRDPSHMAGFGISTYRFFNAQGQSTLIKWYWKPLLGVRSLVYDEATIIAGKNNNFQRVDLYNRIAAGLYPEWEFQVQMFPDDGTFMWNGYDLLIPTQIIPEEVAPKISLGKLTLNRNFDNFFAEPETVAFSPGNVVNGFSWVPDPLLQWRLFSYDDTSTHRHNSPNTYQLPVNRPITQVENNYRDGYAQNYIFEGDQTSTPNDIGGVVEPGSNATLQYSTSGETVGDGPIGRYTPYFSFFTQARIFWGTMDIYGQQATVDAYRFELGNVGDPQVVSNFINDTINNIDNCLARRVAYGIGAPMPALGSGPMVNITNNTTPYPSLFPLNPNQQPNKNNAGLNIAVLANDTLLSTSDMASIQSQLSAQQVMMTIVAPHAGSLATGVNANTSYIATSSTFYDAVIIGSLTSGSNSTSPMFANSTSAINLDPASMAFVQQAYGHQKPIGAIGSSGMGILLGLGEANQPGVYTGDASSVASAVLSALSGPVRFPQRFPTDDVAAICM